jgi:hypothetical protein
MAEFESLGGGDMTGELIVGGVESAKKGRKGEIQRHGSVSGSPGKLVAYANRWRENYNPLRQLPMAIAVSLLERGQRGDMALLQWTFRFIERRYATLGGLISRCEAPLLNFEWQIGIKEELPAGATKAMAEAQQATLRAAYDGLDNLKQGIRHLHLAEFRGYSHIQKHRDADGSVYHLETLDQWCVCRDGLYGDWWWNPDSRSMTMPGLVLPPENHIGGDALPLGDFIIEESERPIDEIGLVNFIRANLCEKDWDGFIEIYGIPGGVVTMPPNVPQGKEAEYESAAQQVAEGGSGAIPNGSDYKPNDGPRGVDPFTPRLRHLDEQMVLIGTGGKLTMMAESGSGTLAGGAHEDAFEEIAAARAEKISERFQRDFDAEVLDREHEGEPVCAFFRIVPTEAGAAESLGFTRDMVKGLLRNPAMGPVVIGQLDLKETLRASGVVINEEAADPQGEIEQIKEQALQAGDKPEGRDPKAEGSPKAEGRSPNGEGNGEGDEKVLNRAGTGAGLEASGKRLVIEALQSEFEGLNARLEAIAEIADPETQKRKLAEVMADLESFEKDLARDPAVAGAIYKILAAGLGNGIADSQAPIAKGEK